ncbi:hypothetical protein A2U01_0084607, partial [Trifolium medium]|nr:hypothetical protein [Trifolium medium]
HLFREPDSCLTKLCVCAIGQDVLARGQQSSVVRELARWSLRLS